MNTDRCETSTATVTGHAPSYRTASLCRVTHWRADDAARCAVSEADANDWQGSLNRARRSRGESKRPALRRLYRAAKAGRAPTGWQENEALHDAAQVAGAECYAAFRKLGMAQWMVCPHCKGDGISRGTDRGMGCGICHGHRTVLERVVDAVFAHRRTIERKYGYSMV